MKLDPDAVVASRPASETARRLVNALKPHGVGSINGAYSAYGRLLSWVVDHCPESTAVHGSDGSDSSDDNSDGYDSAANDPRSESDAPGFKYVTTYLRKMMRR